MPASTISVLYIDDEAALLDICRIFLERGSQFSVTTAESARAALALMETEQFDIIVSDYQMPVMDGITLLKKVRQQSDIPFILFTGKGREEVVIEAINSGADFYIQKGGEPTAQFTELAHKIRLAVERRRSEAALREKTEEIDHYFSSSLDLFCIADMDGRFRRLNPEWERLLGYPVQDLIGKRFLDFVHPDDLPATIDAVTRIAEKQDILNFINRYRCSDGTYRWIEWRSIPSGNLIYASARDITDRIAAEEALRNSERRLSDLINFLPDATFAIDRHGKIIAWNRAIEKMTGVPAVTIIGKGEYEYALPFYGERRPILIDLVLGEHPEAEKKYPVIHKKDNKLISEIFVPFLNAGNGAYLWFTASPLFDNKGEIYGAIESIRDITDRKKAEDALRAAEDKLSTIFRSSPDIITISELDTGRFLDVNDAAVRIFGFERDEFTGKNALEMGIWINPEDRAALINRIQSEERVQRFETRQRRKNGEIFVAAISAGTIMLGGIRYLISTIRDISELKRTEQALKESEERYRNVVEGQTEFISRFKPDGIHVFANDAYLRYFGRTREELIGQKFIPSIPEEDSGRVRRHFASLNRENPSATIEHRIVMPDGSIRWQQWSDTAVFDDEGTVSEYQSVGRDITSRKLAEEQVQASEERYRSLTEASPDLIFVIDADDRVSYVNTAAARMLNVSREHVTGIPREHLFPPEISRHQRTQIDTVLATHKPVHSEGPLSFSGTEYHFDHYLVPINDADGRTTAVLGISRDISDRRRMEKALLESERNYRSVIENLQDAFYRADKDGTITMVSPSAVEMTGYGSIDEVIGLNLARDFYMDPSQRAVFLEALTRTGSVQDFQAILKKKDGSPFIVSTSAHICRDAEGTVIGIEGIAKDITELKRAEEALRQSESRLSSIIRVAPIGIGVVSNRIIQSANDRLCQMTGYSAGELIGQSARILYPTDEDYNYVGVEKYDQIQRYGSGSVETRWQKKDGTMIDILLSSTPIDPLDHALGVTFTALDITRLRQATLNLKQRNEEISAALSGLTAREEELRKSYEELARVAKETRELNDSLPDIIYRADTEGNIVYMNRKGLELLEVTEEDMINQPFLPNLHPDDIPEAMAVYRQLLETGDPVSNFECRFMARRGEGRIFPVIQNISAIRNGHGAIVGTQGIAIDISDKKRAEDALKENEARMRRILEQVPGTLWATDASLIFTSSYGAALRKMGLEPDQVVGTSLDAFYDGQPDKDEAMQAHRRALAGETVAYDTRYGDCIFNAQVEPMRGPDGSITGTLGIAYDVTDMQRAQEVIRRSEELYRSLVDATPDGICITNREGTIAYASSRAVRLFGGGSPDEAIGGSIFDWIATDDSDRAKEDLRKVMAGLHPPATAYRAVRKDGSTFWAEINVAVIQDAAGGISGMVASIRDITDRIGSQDALRVANTKLNLLSSITRHDILNKIMIIEGYLTLLKEMPDPAEGQAYMEKIGTAASVIKNILSFTRDYQNMGVRAPEWLDAGTVFARQLEEFDTRKISVKNNLLGIQVYADPLLEKVMYNLIDNAFRYGRNLTQITASSAAEGDDLLCIVENDGVGIPWDNKERIFERGVGKGTGLGLFLVREILAVTGMTIKETGEPDKGARFEILVPKGKYRIG